MDETSPFMSLHEAVIDGDLIRIKYLISQGISVNAVDNDHWTALMIAARTGNNEVLNLLIDLGADLNMGNVRGETALTCAIKARQTQSVLALLDAGADSTIRDENGDDALLCATRLDAIDIVKNLLHREVDVNCLNDEGDSCLGFAFKTSKSEMVMTFLGSGMLNNTIDDHGNSLLVTAARLGDVDTIHTLIHFKADLDFQNGNKFTALITAVQNNHYDVAQVLVKAGARLDITNRYGDTALTVACRNGNLHAVKFLLDSGANIEEGGTMKISPLMHAAFYCQLDVMYELLQRGANVNAKNIDGETALATFCHKPTACEFIQATCEILIEYGADVNLKDVNNLPPLVKAIINNKSEFAQILISCGADVEVVVCTPRFRGRETPLILATRLNRINVVQSLLKYNADVNATDRRGSTALHLAQDDKLISLLIEADADLDCLDGDGMTPLMIASSANSVGAVKSLIQAGACVNLRHYASDYSALYYATRKNNNNVVEILMQAGAELRYEFHIAIKLGAKNIVRTMVMNGALPTSQNTKHKGSKSSKTPFSNAILCGEISIALYLDSIWFFNSLDMHEFPQTTSLQKSLKDGNKLSKTTDFVNHLWMKPRNLIILSFVAVSSAVGFNSNRAERVNELDLPSAFKRRLMFQDEDTKLPVEEWRTEI